MIYRYRLERFVGLFVKFLDGGGQRRIAVAHPLSGLDQRPAVQQKDARLPRIFFLLRRLLCHGERRA